MFIKLIQQQAQLAHNYTVEISADQTSLTYINEITGERNNFPFKRVFPEMFLAQNTFSEIPTIQRFIQGENAIIFIVGKPKSGKRTTFLSLIEYVAKNVEDATISIGAKQYDASYVIDSPQELAKDVLRHEQCKVQTPRNELCIFKVQSYQEENLAIFSYLLSPGIYFRQLKTVFQQIQLSQLFLCGRYARNVDFLACFVAGGMEATRETSGCCSNLNYLKYLLQLQKLAYQEADDNDELLVHIEQIQEQAQRQAAQERRQSQLLQETLDRERTRFAAELRGLQVQLSNEMQKNELLMIKLYELEGENQQLKMAVRGVEENYSLLKEQSTISTQAARSLREELEQKQHERQQLRQSELQVLNSSVRQKSLQPKGSLSYRKVENQ